MNNALKTLALLFCLPLSNLAWGGTCVALDYQEMKDISKEDLTKEYCKASSTMKLNTLGAKAATLMADVQRKTGEIRAAKDNEAENEKYIAENSQCEAQIERMKRVLTQKGVEDFDLKILCPSKKQNQ